MRHTATIVRASVAETEFFKNIKHLFSGSFIFLGELMQNARRAGASRIDFRYDKSADTLSIVDDGKGIADFANLLTFSKSGWDAQTSDRERPFGMGVFSLFHVAERVVFSSGYRQLAVGLQDVVEASELQVEDKDQLTTGTTIEMQGLQASLFDKVADRSLTLLDRIKNLAQAFPIPVFFNDEEIERPLALDKLHSYATTVGAVTFNNGGLQLHSPRLFLQGLPLGSSYHSGPIVHLDSTAFQAVMPDRQQLYDHESAMKRIDGAVKDAARRHLRDQHAAMGPEGFAKMHWNNAMHLGGLEDLLLGMDFIPGSLLDRYAAVTADREEATNIWDKSKIVHRDAFESGQIKVWLDGPDTSLEHGFAPVLMEVALQQGIANTQRSRFPSGHWLEKLAPNAYELELAWEVRNPGVSTRAQGRYEGVTATACDGVHVTIKSHELPAFVIECTITDAPVLLPEDQDVESQWNDELQEEAITVFVPALATSTPEIAFTDFRDDMERYDESWHDAIRHGWSDAYATLKGRNNLHYAVSTALQRGDVSFRVSDDLVLVQASTEWSEWAADWRDPRLEAHALDEELLQRVAKRLPGVSAQDLLQALQAELKPGQRTIGEPASVLMAAARARLYEAGAVWWLQQASTSYKAPLETPADAGEEERMAAALRLIRQRAADAEGLTLVAFEALPLPEQAHKVREVWLNS